MLLFLKQEWVLYLVSVPILLALSLSASNMGWFWASGVGYLSIVLVLLSKCLTLIRSDRKGVGLFVVGITFLGFIGLHIASEWILQARLSKGIDNVLEAWGKSNGTP